jgi:retron-type reverse transcriptase
LSGSEQHIHQHSTKESNTKKSYRGGSTKHQEPSTNGGADIIQRYSHLFKRITSLSNIENAHINAKKGKEDYAEVKIINQNSAFYLKQLQKSLLDHTFTTSGYRTKQITEPKPREIFILPYYPDRIVHHAIMQVLQPIWDKMFIYDLYSAIPGKGIHNGHYRLRKFLKDEQNTKYCLKFDISKFYPNINHDILYNQVQSKIKCPETLWLLKNIIHSIPGKTNVPIGNYLSQYLSNVYLNNFDHWLKEDMQTKYYIRYCDDGVILNRDKEYLKYLLVDIEKYFKENLHLKLNTKTRIFNVNQQGIDFLGYREFRTYSLLRKSSARTFKKRITQFSNHPEKHSAQHIVSSVMSMYGWAKHCNSYNLQNKYLFSNEKLKETMEKSCLELQISNPMNTIDYYTKKNQLVIKR